MYIVDSFEGKGTVQRFEKDLHWLVDCCRRHGHTANLRVILCE